MPKEPQPVTRADADQVAEKEAAKAKAAQKAAEEAPGDPEAPEGAIFVTASFFSYLAPDPSTINLHDIALGLSRSPRWRGFTEGPAYTVAEHSVHVAILVRKFGGSLDDQRAALMHDAAEAYLGDHPTPLKRVCPELVEIEHRIMRAVIERFDLAEPDGELIHRADVMAGATERRDLKPFSPRWAGLAEPAREQIHPLGNPTRAAANFIALARNLGLS